MSKLNLVFLLALSLIICAAVGIGACANKNKDKDKNMSVSGSVQLGGKSLEVKKCKVGARGMDQDILLTLSDGSVLKLLVHGSEVHHKPKGGDFKELECTDSSGKMSSGDHYFKGTLKRECTLGKKKLALDLELTCGKKP
jgi:hypothetical protein